MDGGSNKTAAATAATGEAVIFSIIIRKLEKDGITDGRRRLWVRFSDAPHVAVVQRDDGYVVWLWREGVAVKIILDSEFNVVGFDVEGP